METLFRWIDLNGVATRRQVWTAFLLLVALGVGLAVLHGVDPDRARFAFPLLGASVGVFVCTLVRRLHDAGLSGYWSLALLIPGAGALVLLYGLLRRSKRRYADGHPVARIVGSFGLMAIFVLSCLRVVWAPFSITAESMKPTLLIGDYLVARQGGAGRLVRGDVMVFRDPSGGEPLVARLIGVPGDRVQMVGGRLVIDGQAVPQVAVGLFEEVMEPQGPFRLRPRCENGPVGEGGRCTKSRLMETLPGGASHPVLNIDPAGFSDDTEAITVPPGRLFVLGDNRDNSLDSRYSQASGGMGLVPAEAVVGRVDRIIFSAAGQRLVYFWTWRSDRFFRAVE